MVEKIEIKKVFDRSEKAVKEAEQDRLFIITGQEGSGKSLLARQFAYYLDKNFSLDDVCFTAEEVEKRIRQKERYGVVILDEGNRGLSYSSALTKVKKKLLSLIQEMRQLNLFFIICIPSVFLLERYLVLHRAYALFHTAIYRKDYKKRYFMVYNKKNMKQLWILGQKHMSYAKPRIHKKFRFYGKQIPTVTKEAYDKKKLESFREEPNKVPEKIRSKENFAKLCKHLHEEEGKTYKELEIILQPDSEHPYNQKEISKIVLNLQRTPQIPI